MKTLFRRINSVKTTLKFVFIVSVFSLLYCTEIVAQKGAPMRRPISTAQPMWLIHVDTWNTADPQKIIDLIPKDIRPYVVMNLSLSINHDPETGAWKTVEYGYETAKSWLRTCAENRMWAIIQPSSGGFSHFSDYDLSVYEEWFREYPNFIGMNYCEQFWGFDDKFSLSWTERIAHFTNLMKLNQKYGGYLVVSWCGAYYGAGINPIAMMKKNPAFAAICKEDPEHFILCEKFTSAYGFLDIESTCLGTYLSGYSGHYGIRFDQCGWNPYGTADENFPVAAGIMPVVEHLALTGQTVIDGPELIWQQCFRELSAGTTSDGYRIRRWERFPQFNNISIDIFRKVLDGSIRLMSKKEVIDRTKIVLINDATTGNDQNKYSAPQYLYDGLYKMDDDGTYLNQKSWMKKTGRYPAIPVVFQLADSLSKTFQVKVNTTTYSSRWATQTAKTNEFNNLFPQEYKGDIYAANADNDWVTYNPFKSGKTATGVIPFKFNTCDSIKLTYSQYTLGLINEFPNSINLYLSNYDNLYTALKTDTIRIYGSTNEPTYTYKDRASHQASTVTKEWVGGVFTLYVRHNGPLDVTINCAGTAANRLTEIKPATLVEPKIPGHYTGPRQYEVENFDYKNVSNNFTNAVNTGVKNYTGQGFLRFGTNGAASVRDTITVLKSGKYRVKIKYSAATGDVRIIRFYVNGQHIYTPLFPKTNSESDWAYKTMYVNLNAGKNVLMLGAYTTGTYALSLDHFIIERDDVGMYNFDNDPAGTAATTPAASYMDVQSGSAGIVNFTDGNSLQSKVFKTYSVGNTNTTGIADLSLFQPDGTNYAVIWKGYDNASGSKKGVILRAQVNENCSYAGGMKPGYVFIAENNADQTITLKSYIADTNSLTEKTSYTSTFQIQAGKPCWYRASTFGNTIKFECSEDSTHWIGGTTTAFTDNKYAVGSTQLIWGLGSTNTDWMMDNLSFKASTLSVSKLELLGFTYSQGFGPSNTQTLGITAKDLLENLVIDAPTGFEISSTEAGEFGPTLILSPDARGAIPTSNIYIRLIQDMSVGTCQGKLILSSAFLDTISVSISGNISASLSYNFNTDASATYAQTPPAKNISIPSGNNATAGVAMSPGINSKAFRPYSGGERHGTGAATLSLFPSAATDYSVTWKYTYGTASTDYKNGVLLRGTAPAATTTTGYSCGLMQGYIFLAYHNSTRTNMEFRIYKSSNSTTELPRLTGVTMNVSPAIGTPIWFRASATGKTNVNLKFEYSLDSTTWTTAATSIDASSPFTAGATQIMWGLDAGGIDFYMDNITFSGSTGAPAGVNDVLEDNADCVSTEYFSIDGTRVRSIEQLKGLFIVRKTMSNGTVKTFKYMMK